LNERFLWNALKQTEKKILQEEKNSMIMGREKNTRISDKVTNTQLDIITYSKTQTDIQEDQPNGRAIKKTYDTNSFKAIYTLEKDRVHWANQLLNEIL